MCRMSKINKCMRVYTRYKKESEKMEQFFKAIDEKIRKSGYPGEVSGFHYH